MRSKLYRFISWPLILFCVLFGFSFCLFYVLPYVNGIGMRAFYANNDIFIMYFFVPFAAVDTVILLGYCKAVRYFAPRMDRKVQTVVHKCFGRIFCKKYEQGV